MKLYKIFVLTTLFLLIFVIGCSDRGVNYDKDTYELSEGTYFTKEGAHVFHDELLYQINNKFQQMPLAAYWPKDAFPINVGGKFVQVPMLILLPPQDGNENFYFQHGLKELADELISKGEIKPMAILCVPNDKIFGGYFFAGNSPAAGFYDDLIGDELVRFAEEEFFVTTLRTKENRAIGGFGMGAYGAFRAAMLNPDAFGAVSGVTGPMDFDGINGDGGFEPLFIDALTEQGLVGQNLQDATNGYQSNGTQHLSRLFVGGSFAFSAHDTMLYTSDTVKVNPSTGLLRVEYTLDSLETLDTAIFKDANRITFLAKSAPPNIFQNETDFTFSFHLPFDNTGSIVNPVWDRWLANNLPTLFDANQNVFDGVNLWIANSSESTFGNYYDQTNSWISTLNAASSPVSLTEYNYNGYDGHPANKDQYMYDILREMLIFHSDNFGN